MTVYRKSAVTYFIKPVSFQSRVQKGRIIRITLEQLQQNSHVLTKLTESNENVVKRGKRIASRGKRRIIRYGLLGVNMAIVFCVAVFIVVNRGKGELSQPSVLNLVSSEQAVSNPLDALSSADIAVNIALMTHMPQTTAVLNHADSASAQEDVVPSGFQAIGKPQIVETRLKSKNDIREYVVLEGDTIDSVANKFGITSKSVRWSNKLENSGLTVGSTILIPPVEGIVYTVADGDTPNTVANKFHGNESRIIAFNDAELGGLSVGDKIVIPDGQIIAARPTYSASVAYGFRATYGPANGYDFGWCTWHAANRRREIGNPVPTNLGNAVTWSARARAAGMTVSDVPIAGAVIWHDQSKSGYVAGGLGHVAYVESVNADGSIIVSDMNSRGVSNPDLTGGPAGGWARVSYRLVTPQEFYKYDFIY